MATITQITTYRVASRWHPGDVAALRRLHPGKPGWLRHLWWCLWGWPRVCYLAIDPEGYTIGAICLSHCGVVSVVVEPSWRRRGVAVTLLSILQQSVKLPTYTALVAYIDAGVVASLALFRRAGFVPQPTLDVDGQSVWRWYSPRVRYRSNQATARDLSGIHRE